MHNFDEINRCRSNSMKFDPETKFDAESDGFMHTHRELA